MNRHLVATLMALSCLIISSRVYAQVTNYALQLSPQKRLETIYPVNIESESAYTIQLSIKCNVWQQDGVIFSCGDFRIAQSDVDGILDITTPQSHTHKLSIGDHKNEWIQLSLVASNEALNIWVNGELHDSYSGNYRWSNKTIATLGGGFTGCIDELRIFSVALQENELSHFNTLTHHHKNWDDMALYYRFDHSTLEDRVVDYRGNNDGHMSEGDVLRTKNCDQKSKYMVISGYSSFIRHNDRPFIDKQMHLMTNDLIMLDAIVDGHSGRIYMQSAENGELTHGAKYLKTLDGRQGVLKLDGKGSLNYNDNNFVDLHYLSNTLNFSTWLRLDKWHQGAMLYKKVVDVQNGVTVSLSSKSRMGLEVSLEGQSISFDNVLKNTKEWQHVAVNILPKDGKSEVSVYLNNKLMASKSINEEFIINDMEATTYIGCGIDGALDNIIIGSSSRNNFADYMSGKSSDLQFPNGGASGSQVLGAWLFDCEQRPERNIAGWQSKIEQIHEIYSGYTGYKIRFGIITHTADQDGNKIWSKSILNEAWRTTLSADVARIAKHFDGVDIDFEWLDNNPQNEAWQAYGELIKSLRQAIGEDKVLSASLHPVSYTLPLDSEVMDCVDYITVQNYGPRHTYLKMDRYEKFFDDAVNYGIPPQKLFLSMATLIVRSDNSGLAVSGYKNLNFDGFSTSTNQAIYNGVPYTFNSVDEVIRKMELLRARGSNGCMYFDMGNDLQVDHPFSLIRALNSVISSNVDKVIY
ncbi:MAG: LamG-like jellyroll fold domain-containing protein [Rikenellaceae bacterium]